MIAPDYRNDVLTLVVNHVKQEVRASLWSSSRSRFLVHWERHWDRIASQFHSPLLLLHLHSHRWHDLFPFSHRLSLGRCAPRGGSARSWAASGGRRSPCPRASAGAAIASAARSAIRGCPTQYWGLVSGLIPKIYYIIKNAFRN